MSTVSQLVSDKHQSLDATVSQTNTTFLKFLPAVQTHAAFTFRNLTAVDREEKIAEATAASFLNVHSSIRNGKSKNLRPSMVARYAVLHVRSGKHVGGSQDGAKDVLSPRAQSRHGFEVLGLPWDSPHAYDCMKDTSSPAWKNRLKEDRRANVADLAAFRLDLSDFLRQQQDRTRRALGMLAAGHKQTEVADCLGISPSGVCQRVKKAEREWMNLQDIDTNNDKPTSDQSAPCLKGGAR